MIGDLLKLLRPKQWTKNLLVLAAPIFAAKITEMDSLARAGLALLAMCLMSSATYVFNDLFDIERDQAHPTKQNRPLASGAVSVGAALLLGGACFMVALGIGFALNRSSGILLCSYAVLQFFYNFGLKRAPIADVFTIALGFIVRAMLGAAAVWVPISGWLLFCTGALALMLGFAKRRHEFMLSDRGASRESLQGYSKAALDALVTVSASGAAISYGIYTLDSQTAQRYPSIVVTSLFVFFGIARYLLLVFGHDEGGEPADLLVGDRYLLAAVAGFMLTAICAVSGMQIPLLER